jgi:phage terminase large subunit GpA-like protein
MGQSYTVWVLPPGKRNEVLDTFVGALAVRRSLPRRIEAGLEYETAAHANPDRESSPPTPPQPVPPPTRPVGLPPRRHGGFLERRRNWL